MPAICKRLLLIIITILIVQGNEKTLCEISYGTNLLSNPSFEKAEKDKKLPSGWTLSDNESGRRILLDRKSGTHCLSLKAREGTEKNVFCAQRDLPVSKNVTYRV